MDNAESVAILEASSQHDEQQRPPASSIVQELLAGGIAGCAGILVGHPFDSYKVKLQTSISNSTTRTSPRTTTLSSLFRGIGPPLAMAAIVNATVFVSYNSSSRMFDDMTAINADSTDATATSSFTRIKPFVCGMFTGVISSLVIAPTEHIKCRLQVNHNNYRGPIDAVRRIVSSHGVFTGLYRGFGATVLRQSPSFGVYFGTYDSIKVAVSRRYFGLSNNHNQQQHSSRRLVASALAGGLAGSLAWAAIYPMDVIKSRIQTMPLEKPRSIQDVAQTLYATGWRSVYRGIGITVLRAFPVNGIIFPVYEFSLQQLHGTFSTTTTADGMISHDVGTTLASYPTIKR
jgi:hypothetical protein